LLWADPDRITQLLTNLLSNAIKFSPPESTVWLRAERREVDLVITVSDQGRGIPEDKLESIFERFQQVDASDSRVKGGRGLGLAIRRSIVQHHDGQIWAESTHGAGSTFFVSLPVGENLSLQHEEPKGSTVLVCDDEASVIEVIAGMLRQRGYRVVGSTSDAEAVARASELRPSAILLDLLMPGMFGWETLAALKERAATRHIPVLILSAMQPEPGGSWPVGCRGPAWQASRAGTASGRAPASRRRTLCARARAGHARCSGPDRVGLPGPRHWPSDRRPHGPATAQAVAGRTKTCLNFHGARPRVHADKGRYFWRDFRH